MIEAAVPTSSSPSSGSPPRSCRRPWRCRRGGRGAPGRAPGPALVGAVRRQRARRHRHRGPVRHHLGARRAPAPRSRRWPTSCPTILYNSGYAVVLGASYVFRWPLVGFMVGSVTGDPTAWRQTRRWSSSAQAHLAADPAVHPAASSCRVRSGSPASPGRSTPTRPSAILGVLKIGMGWPLQVAAITGMVWMLGRDRTPVDPGATPRASAGTGAQPPWDRGASNRSSSSSTSAGMTNTAVAGLDRLLGVRT